MIKVGILMLARRRNTDQGLDFDETQILSEDLGKFGEVWGNFGKFCEIWRDLVKFGEMLEMLEIW